MRALSAEELLRIWELGEFQPLPERALMLLDASFPSIEREELEQMSIGERDSLLLTLREHLFGSRFAGLSDCPVCSSKIEIDFESSEIRTDAASIGPFQFCCGDYKFMCRVPNSSDLLQLQASSSLEEQTNALLDKCLVERSFKGDQVSISQLPVEVVAAINAELSKRDPQADVCLNLVCPDCSHEWEVIFDIVSFAWQELSVWAGRLLRQIHTLAAGYGWREQEILALGPLRRQAYLEMLRA